MNAPFDSFPYDEDSGPGDPRDPDPASGAPQDEARTRTGRAMLAFLVFVIVLAGAGFVFKLIEFMHTLDADASQSFALMPVVTYLTVAAGFFCLLIWSILGGHFKDLERPKHTMLEFERELDRRGPGTALKVSDVPEYQG